MSKEKYDASSIGWKKGVEAVRDQVSFYVGSTGSGAITHLAYEIIGNSIDEASSGYGDTVAIDIDTKNNSIIIGDHGRGIPVGKHPKHPDYDVMTLVATELHAGGKARSKNDGYAGGTLGCFAGNTKIRLFGHKPLKIKDLYKEYKKKFATNYYTFAKADAELLVRPILDVQKTRKVSILAYVYIEGVRKPVKCTIDHPFLTKTGMVQAKDLTKDHILLGDVPSDRMYFYDKDLSGNVCGKRIKKVSIKRQPKPVQVYGLTVPERHNYLLDAGVLVGNTHGLGLAVVNALSSNLELWSYRKNRWYYQAFKDGKPVKSKPITTTKYPKIKGHSGKDGTIVRWSANLSCFDKGSRLDVKALLKWLDDLSWFVTRNEVSRGKIKKRHPVKFVVTIDGKTQTIKSTGFAGYYDHVLQTHKLEPVGMDKPFVLQTDSLDVILGWSSSDEDLIKGYTNGAYNVDGGTHVSAVVKTIGKVFSKYARKSQSYKVQDLIAGAIGVVNVRIKSPRFMGQAKNKLVSEEVTDIVKEVLEPALTKWAKQNKDTIKDLIQRASEIAKATAALKNNKKLAAALKTTSKGKTLYPEKMLVSLTKNPEERELYIIEGDSAGGSAKKASDRHFQEVLPLRGKIPNAMRGEEKAFASQIVIDVLRAIGYNVKDETKKLRVGKVIFLTDSDHDGFHIAALLMGLFHTVAPELYEQGKVFVADTPLYTYNGANGQKTYAATLQELLTKVKGKVDNTRITRAKGLGEVSADVLHEVAFNPKTRKHIKLTPELVRKRLMKVMGDDVEFRKQMLGLS